MKQILEKIAGARIIVVGDVMLDRYWWGTVDRISPEAPVPIVSLEKMSLVAGGAANVAANLAGLGARPELFGIRGDDEEGQLVTRVLSDSAIDSHFIAPIVGRKTTIKTRIVAHSQHVVRIDHETSEPVPNEVAEDLLSRISVSIKDADAIILSDYAKGVFSDFLLSGLINEAKSAGKLLVVDPKKANFQKYRGASVITPNKREACAATNIDPDSPNAVTEAGARLMRELDLTGLLITEGEHGMRLFEQTREPRHLESLAQDVYDVTGAGDTVIATFTAAAATGASFLRAAELANIAAALAVGHIGTTRVSAEMIDEHLSSPDIAHRSHA